MSLDEHVGALGPEHRAARELGDLRLTVECLTALVEDLCDQYVAGQCLDAAEAAETYCEDEGCETCRLARRINAALLVDHRSGRSDPSTQRA